MKLSVSSPLSQYITAGPRLPSASSSRNRLSDHSRPSRSQPPNASPCPTGLQQCSVLVRELRCRVRRIASLHCSAQTNQRVLSSVSWRSVLVVRHQWIRCYVIIASGVYRADVWLHRSCTKWVAGHFIGVSVSGVIAATQALLLDHLQLHQNRHCRQAGHRVSSVCRLCTTATLSVSRRPSSQRSNHRTTHLRLPRREVTVPVSSCPQP